MPLFFLFASFSYSTKYEAGYNRNVKDPKWARTCIPHIIGSTVLQSICLVVTNKIFDGPVTKYSLEVQVAQVLVLGLNNTKKFSYSFIDLFSGIAQKNYKFQNWAVIISFGITCTFLQRLAMKNRHLQQFFPEYHSRLWKYINEIWERVLAYFLGGIHKSKVFCIAEMP